ncbi:MAG TPA: hypothetical protein VMB73_15290 [Acetobacteraceae bacterium]|jgi:hypothetical protein|nr:hypothetical protein [Acetobacteraceae bacterium]
MRQFARLRMKVQESRRAATALDDAIVRTRINRSMRRRMSDELVKLIDRACLCGHAETAKGLWIVLRDLLNREARQRYPNGRLPEKDMLKVLAAKITEAAGDTPPKR